MGILTFFRSARAKYKNGAFLLNCFNKSEWKGGFFFLSQRYSLKIEFQS